MELRAVDRRLLDDDCLVGKPFGQRGENVAGQERLPCRGRIRGGWRTVRLRRRRVPLRKSVGKRPAHGGRRSEDRELGRAALDLVGVVTDDRDPRPGLREAARGVRRLTEGGRADHQDRVVGCEPLAQPRAVRRKHSREEPVVLREPGPRTERLLEHGGDEPLGEADEGFPRLGVVGSRADDQRRCPGAVEKPGELLHRGRVGGGGPNDARGRRVLPIPRRRARPSRPSARPPAPARAASPLREPRGRSRRGRPARGPARRPRRRTPRPARGASRRGTARRRGGGGPAGRRGRRAARG